MSRVRGELELSGVRVEFELSYSKVQFELELCPKGPPEVQKGTPK